MQTYTIKKKEININNPNTFLVEDEIAPEYVQFIINDASVIENVGQLEFFLQYKNKLGEHGIEILTSTYENGVVALDWYPSKEFTKESGRTEIQIFGVVGDYEHTPDETFQSDAVYYVLDDDLYVKITPETGASVSAYETEHDTLVYEYFVNTRWSTIKTTVNLPENIHGADFDYYDSNKLNQILQAVLNSEANSKVYAERAEDAERGAETAQGKAEDAQDSAETAQGLAEDARDLAQGYASDASDAKDFARGYATDADNARIASVGETISPDDGGTNTITITYKDGTVKTFTVTNGHTGEAFYVYKTYSSISAMNADIANVPKGKFVVIASNVTDPDNAKLYYRRDNDFQFITDMSGATGAGVPASGTTGQVLKKKSNTDYDIEWANEQDVSGKANKSEMGVSTSGDKTTITLKTGTSAEVINQHQDISGLVPKTDIVDYLTSSATNQPLSAKQGKVLNGKIVNIEEVLMGEHEVTVSYPNDGTYSAIMPNGVPLRSCKYAEVQTIKGKTRAWNQYVDTNTTTVTLLSGHVFFTVISNTYAIINGTGQSISVTGGVDIVRDLTLIFGAGNEPSTVADALAQLPALGQYNAYNAGSLVSTEVSGVKSVGVNLWDEEWENNAISPSDGEKFSHPNSICSKNPVKVFPNTSYYFKVASNSRDQNLLLCEYSADGTYLGYNIPTINNPAYTTRIDTAYIQFYWDTSDIVGEYDHTFQFCLNSLPDAIKQTYHPYKTDSLSLSTPVTLKSAGSVAEVLTLETGKKTKPIGSVDLGTLNWDYNSNFQRWNAGLTGLKNFGQAVASNYVCTTKNPALETFELNELSTCWFYWGGEPRIFVYNGSSSVSPTGYLNYELDTPDPDEQVCDPVPYNFLEVEGGGTINTVQEQSPVIDNCLDATYDIIPQ